MKRLTIDFGIDLGTTNSSIACFDGQELQVFRNYKNQELTPSVVHIEADGKVIVGSNAYELLLTKEKDTHSRFKRQMGTEQQYEFESTGKVVKPEELSAEVLKELKESVRLSEEEDVKAAVIGVPANFEIVQREATQRAAQLAGIKYSILYPEPMLASIAYGLREDMPKGPWMIYDLGGGTFDISIMVARKEKLCLVDTCGNNYLGGTDFDWLIVENIVYPVLKSEYNLPDLSRGNEIYDGLNAIVKFKSEEAKIELSMRELADIRIQTERFKDKDGKAIDIKIPISQNQYDSLVEKPFSDTIELCKKVLDKQGMKPSDIEMLILVGGPMLYPVWRKNLEEALGIRLVSKDPMTVVARGAAIAAHSELMPKEIISRDASKVFIELKYPSVTSDNKVFVGGRILPSESGIDISEAASISITHDGGEWQSGRVEIKDGIFETWVSVLEKGITKFSISLIDREGNAIKSEPESFSIMHGLSLAEPPLSHSIGVELEDGSFDKIIKAGSILPARGRFSYHTTREVKPGVENDVLNIRVYEGEYEISALNRYLAILIISGKQVSRTVPENTTIEITLKVDKSGTVTAEAYIPILPDQKFSEIRPGIISPKPNPDLLLKELQEEEKKLSKLEEIALEADDESMKDNLKKLKEKRVAEEIKREIEAAKGGDQDAPEKADRQLKDFRAMLDPIEYAAHWPKIFKEYNETVQYVSRTVESFGNEEEKNMLSMLIKEAEGAIESKNTKHLQRIANDIMGLYWSVSFRQDGFWIGAFQNIRTNPPQYTNPEKAKQLVEEGAGALQRQDIESLKTIMWELWQLIPAETQLERGKQITDSGLRK